MDGLAYDVVGSGPDALLLPALSSIATRDEMRPLAERLGQRFRCVLPDWPGFGSRLPSGAALSPGVLDDFLDRHLVEILRRPALGVAAGHGAAYLVRDARRHPDRYDRLVLIAPTWRGPLPTMTQGRRPRLCAGLRKALETPVTGPLLYRLNLSRPVISWMMREHVYVDPSKVVPTLVEANRTAAGRPDARFATAAFVSGGLDPVGSRDEFLALFGDDLPPTLILRPRSAPVRSGTEMDALTARGTVSTVEVALAPHDENPDVVASAVLSFAPPVSFS